MPERRMKDVQVPENATPDQLREAARAAEANAAEANREAARWERLAVALRQRAELADA